MANEQRTVILCPKCLELKFQTRHHIYPRRFFGNGSNAPILYLCDQCHKGIEAIIPRDVELEPEDYLQIAREYLYPDQCHQRR